MKLQLFLVVYLTASIARSNRTDVLARPRIVILGATGVGKSTLANVLLGRDKNGQAFKQNGQLFEQNGQRFKKNGEHSEQEGQLFEEKGQGSKLNGQEFEENGQRSESDNGCFKVSVMNHKETSMTKKACYDQGHWLGNATLPVLTVIDTPGFGNDLVEEQASIENLISVLRDEINSVDVFVLAFKQQDNRMSPSLRSMIGLIQKMFGKHFWNNVILEATHWNYDPASIKRRSSADKPMTEEWWAREFNSLLSNDFGVDQNVPAVFIDSFHDVDNDFEVDKFRENVEKLKSFAETRDPFECKDIQTALSEIHQLQQKLESLKTVNQNMSETIQDLKLKLISSHSASQPDIWRSPEKDLGYYCDNHPCFTQHQFAIYGFLIFAGSILLVIVFVLIRGRVCFRNSRTVEDGIDKRDSGGFESGQGLLSSSSEDFRSKEVRNSDQNNFQSPKKILATQI